MLIDLKYNDNRFILKNMKISIHLFILHCVKNDRIYSIKNYKAVIKDCSVSFLARFRGRLRN